MNTIGCLTVFYEAQKRGWVNTRSGKSVPLDTPVNTNKEFVFISASELTQMPTQVSYLVSGLIETEALCLIFAPPSAGKSFFAISMAAAIATGTDWLGRKTEAGSVFYLAGEGHAGLARRLKAWELHHGHNLKKTPLFFSKTSAELMDANSANTVTSAIKILCLEHGRPGLIVIDTFARNMGDGDENSNADVGIFVNRIDKIRAELGCAVLLVHHSGHSATDRARGASSLHAAMDTVYRLEKTASGMTMVHIKAKESELNLPLPLALEQVELAEWLDSNGDALTSAVVIAGKAADGIGPVKLTRQQEQALDIFCDAAKAFGQLSSDGKLAGLQAEIWRREYYAKFADKAQGTNKTAFARAQKALVEAGCLASDEHDYYHLSGVTRLTDNTELVRAIEARYGTAQGT